MQRIDGLAAKSDVAVRFIRFITGARPVLDYWATLEESVSRASEILVASAGDLGMILA